MLKSHGAIRFPVSIYIVPAPFLDFPNISFKKVLTSTSGVVTLVKRSKRGDLKESGSNLDKTIVWKPKPKSKKYLVSKKIVR